MEKRIAIIIPCYNVRSKISEVLLNIPDFIQGIIAVDDCSLDDTKDQIIAASKKDNRVKYLYNEKNLGVGGSVINGFNYAYQCGFDILIKMDGDGQMDPKYLPDLIQPIINDGFDFSKGNRFSKRKTISEMPSIRRFGNLCLSFMLKMASGYWKIFDPTNGYFAITSEGWEQLMQNRLAPRYFFESSLLIEMGIAKLRICDVPMDASYGNETSHLSIRRTIFEFPIKIMIGLLRRIKYQYFIFDFSVGSVFLVSGLFFCLFGIVFGAINWINNAVNGIETATGTVMISVLPLIIGFQMLLQFLLLDVSKEQH